MKPKFLQLLETCITDGVILGHKRAYKHNDAPSEVDIKQSIVNEVLNELHDWFDFDELKSIEAPRTWVGLTNEEIEQLHTAWVLGGVFKQLCEAIEAKLKEKNHG